MKNIKKLNEKTEVSDKFNLKRTLVFDMKDEKYGIDVSYAQSVFEGIHVHPVPNTPTFITGIINDRGILKPVIDIRRVFGLESKTGNIIITLHVENIPFGVMADKVDGVFEIDFSKLLPAPHSLERIEAEYIVGIIPNFKRSVLTILDIVKIIKTVREKMLKF